MRREYRDLRDKINSLDEREKESGVGKGMGGRAGYNEYISCLTKNLQN